MKLDGIGNISELQRNTEIKATEHLANPEQQKAAEYMKDMLDINETPLEYQKPQITLISFGSTCTG